MPEVYHERSEYIFVGNMSTAEEGILEDLLTLDNEYDNVKIYDSYNHNGNISVLINKLKELK